MIISYPRKVERKGWAGAPEPDPPTRLPPLDRNEQRLALRGPIAPGVSPILPNLLFS